MLRWEEQKSGGWYAYSGTLIVGYVVMRDDGVVYYDATRAVSMRWIDKGHGEVKSIVTAKRAVARAWSKWLARAALSPARP